jgi:hypothetical protein
MKKISVYVYSVSQIPTTDFVDKEGAMHACARAGNTPFETLRHYPRGLDSSLISNEQKNAIFSVESFCKSNGYDFEVVDFAKLNFLSKVKLRRKGVKSFPTASCGGRFLCGVPTEDDLRELVKA